MMSDLSNFTRCYDNALSSELCDQTIKMFEQHKQYQIKSGSAANPEQFKASDWTELNITHLCDANYRKQILDIIFKYKTIYENEAKISPALPRPPGFAELIIKRYDPDQNERFEPHYDSVGPTAHRYLVNLWYLNDVAEGGETEFVDLNIKIKPKKGRLLIFPPYWMFRHAGLLPISGPKYILSTYYLW